MPRRVFQLVFSSLILATLIGCKGTEPKQPNVSQTPQIHPKDSIVLDSGVMTLGMELDGTHLRLNRLAGSEGENRLNDKRPEGDSLWSLTCIRKADLKKIRRSKLKAELVFEEGDAEDVRIVKASDSYAEVLWSLPYEGETILVRVTIRLSKGEALSYWKIKAELPPGLSLESVTFPRISNLDNEGLKAAWPAGWGWEGDMEKISKELYNWKEEIGKFGESTRGQAPGSFMVMPFIVYYREGHGTYFAAHDPEAYHKAMRTFANEGLGSGSTHCVHYLARRNIDKPTEWTLPYEMVLGIYEGDDYYEGAQIYREFVRTTDRWTLAGEAFENAPEIVKSVDVVTASAHRWSMEEVVELELDFKEYMDGQDHMTWVWHWAAGKKNPETKRDRDWEYYPYMFPPREGWNEGLYRLRENGIIALPYCNTNRVVREKKTFGPEGWHHVSTKYEDGKTFFRRKTRYGPKDYYFRPCPGASQFPQMCYKHIIEPMIKDYGSAAGLYLDQLAAKGPCPCYDPSHNHPAGSGKWWAEGITRLITYLRKQSPETIWMTENNADCYMGLFDLYLILSCKIHKQYPRYAGVERTIPLFPVVWSGRYYPVGQNLRLTANTGEYPRIFRAAAAESLLWGAKFGGGGTGFIMQPENIDSLAYFRKLVRCRREIHAFVQDGEFLGMLEAGGDNPPFSTGPFYGPQSGKITNNPRTMPSVLVAGWKAKDGSVGLVMVNLDEEHHDISIPIPAERAGYESGASWTAQLVPYKDYPANVPLRVRDGSTVEITVPARTPLVVRCTPAGN